MVRGLIMAFQDYRVIGESAFVGLDNFATAFTQRDFWYTMLRTVYYVALTLGIGFVLPILLALMLSEIRLGQYLFRTVYYLPTMTSGLVVMFVWKHLIYPSTESGLLNRMLMTVGFEPQRWIESEGWAMLCVVVPTIWAGVGAQCLIYLAALKTVEESLYEAAAIDGASTWQKLRHVTLPTLKALIIINFVGAFIGAFHAMQNIFVMTEGGPNRATHIMGLEIFYNFVVWLKLGYATAIAWVLGFMLIGFTIVQLRILKNVQFKTAGGGGH
jgi:multiple sugar transport system permease protein